MSETKSLKDQLASNTSVHVTFGFLAMGAWAVFANRDHPLPQALLAGLVQGTISGLLTLFLKKFLEWIGKRLSAPLAALILPPLLTATAIAAILTITHTLAGTPEVLATIAVPFTVSTSYAIVYNLRLWRATHGR